MLFVNVKIALVYALIIIKAQLCTRNTPGKYRRQIESRVAKVKQVEGKTRIRMGGCRTDGRTVGRSDERVKRGRTGESVKRG